MVSVGLAIIHWKELTSADSVTEQLPKFKVEATEVPCTVRVEEKEKVKQGHLW